jgi:aminopeptidase N
LRDAWIDEVDTPVWEYANSASYRTNSYPRPAVILRSLEGLVNRDVFLRGMRHYAETWRYKHPTPDDFFAAFNEGAGVDMDWSFEELFRGTGTVDWAVSVSSKALESPRGMYQGESGVWAELEESDDDATGHRAKILVTREGQLSLPLEIRVTFEGDKVEHRIWTREEQIAQNWIRLEFEETSRVISVELDPDGKWYLDKDMSNNQWFKEKDEVAPVRWGERIFSRFVHSFHWQMGIGG